MKTFFSSTLFWGIISLIVMPNVVLSQDLPLILSSKTMPTETGIKLEFLLSSYIKKDDVSSWPELEKKEIADKLSLLIIDFLEQDENAN